MSNGNKSPLPRDPDEVEASCCHTECSLDLYREILRHGSWDGPEDICLVEGRREDECAERGALASGEYQNHYGRRDR